MGEGSWSGTNLAFPGAVRRWLPGTGVNPIVSAECDMKYGLILSRPFFEAPVFRVSAFKGLHYSAGSCLRGRRALQTSLTSLLQ